MEIRAGHIAVGAFVLPPRAATADYYARFLRSVSCLDVDSNVLFGCSSCDGAISRLSDASRKQKASTSSLAGDAMATEKSESTAKVAPNSIGERPTNGGGASADPSAKSTQTDVPSNEAPARGHHPVRRRRLLMGALGTLVLAAVLIFGIPWVQQALNTVSTDDAYVNGHVTFVAPRVPGEVLSVRPGSLRVVRVG